jgi:CHRD domain
VRKLWTAIVLGTIAALAVAALASGAARDTYMVGAKLTAKAEVPAPAGVPVAAKGSFTGSYVENSKGATLKWRLTFSGLTGPGTAAHIHMGKVGVAGPVIVPLCGPCKSGQSGKATISKAVIAALESGKAYVNVHTAKNAAGEIRGQVKASG